MDVEILPGMVVAESVGRGFWSRVVAKATGSRWTHVALVVDARTLIEAEFPVRVHYAPLDERIAELAAQGRAWVLLDPQRVLDFQRAKVPGAAAAYIGRLYDVLQCLLYAALGRFVMDGPKRVVCSRLVTAVYRDVGLDGFEAYCTPAELVHHPLMTVVHREGNAPP